MRTSGKYILAILLLTLLAASRLAAQRADVLISPTDHRAVSPGLVAFPSGIVCTWQQSDSATSNILRRWDITTDTLGSIVRYVPPGLPMPYVIGGSAISSHGGTTNRMLQFPGDAALTYNSLYAALIKGTYGSHPPIDYQSSIASSAYALARPGPTEWTTVDVISRGGGYQFAPPPFPTYGTLGYVRAFNPDVGEIIVQLDERDYANPNNTSGDLRGITLRGYRADGTHWDIANPPGVIANDPTVLLPIGTARYLLITEGHGKRVNGNAIVNTFALSTDTYLHPRFFKLFGPYFARTSWSSQDSTRFQIETFDTLGHRLHANSVQRTVMTDDYMLVQSSKDSMIAVLFGSNNGLRGTLFKKNLDIIAADTLLSVTTGRVSHPAGAFRHDTLFAVWEDYRDSVSRIYGTFQSFAPKKDSGVNSDTTHHEDTTHQDNPRPPANAPFVYPNPASNTLTLNKDLGISLGGTFELWTPLGQLLHRIPMYEGDPAQHTMTLDISDLPVGVYIAWFHYGSHAMVQLIVKK